MCFIDHVLKHPNLPFATEDEENIYNLKKATGKIVGKNIIDRKDI
jgi:hypothetical protein